MAKSSAMSARMDSLESSLSQLIAAMNRGQAISTSPPTHEEIEGDNEIAETPSAAAGRKQDSLIRDADAATDAATGNEGFPAGKRDAKGKYKAFPVKPRDRQHFMATARKLDFIPVLELPLYKDGKENRVRFTPNSGVLTTKAFSSGNHGLFGQVSYSVSLPDGTEYVLTGQVNLTLTRRKD